MIEWLAKEWYWKLFDTTLGFMVIVGLALVIFILIKSLRGMGLGNVQVDKTGKVAFSFTDKAGEHRQYTIEDLLETIKKKDDEIFLLRNEFSKIQDKIAFMEAEMNKQRAVEEYKNKNKIPFTEHTVFFNLKRNMDGGIDFAIKPDNTNFHKIRIAEDFLCHCKIPVFYYQLKNFVAVIKSDEMSDSEILAHIYTISSAIFEWVREYNEKADDLKIDFGDGTYIKGVPPSFMEAFNKWHDPHVEMVFTKIKDILFNSFYSTWQLKLIMVLDAIDTAFYLTIIDAEKTIKYLNGRTEVEISENLKRY